MKRRAILLALLMVAGLAYAEMQFQSVSVTASSQTITISGASFSIKNEDSTNEIYVRVFENGDTIGAATTSNALIGAGETLSGYRPNGLKAISLICAGGETATASVVYW